MKTENAELEKYGIFGDNNGIFGIIWRNMECF